MKRQVVFPSTPNLFTPSPTLTPAPGLESTELNLSMPSQKFANSTIGESSAVAVLASEPASSTLNIPTSERTFTTEDMDALKNLMKHLYEKTKF